MKAIKLLFLLSIIFLSMQSAQSEEVYCVDVKGSNYTFSQVFDTNSTDASCNAWKSEFWQKNSPDAYQNCLNTNAQLRAAYRSGKCSPVVEKVHNFGSTTCKIKLSYKYKKKLGTYCSGQEANKYSKKLDYMYHDFN